MSTHISAQLNAQPVHGGAGTLRVNRFLAVFYAVVGITAFPSNYVYYVAPFVVVLSSLLGRGGPTAPPRLAALAVGLTALTAISFGWNDLRGLRNNYPGLAFAVVTWLPILILLSNRGARLRMDDRSTRQLVVFLSMFVLLQAAVVVFQVTQTRNWDALAGTFGLLDFRGSVTISQVFFTFNIFVISLFLIPYSRRPIVKIALIAGFASVAAAQSGHQTIFFLVTVLIVFASLKRFRVWLRVVFAGFFLVAAVLWFFPQTPDLAMQWALRAVFQDFPKRLMVVEAYELLKDPKISLVGTGIGQFTSRAALFSSGEYLSTSLPSVITGQSVWYEEIVAPLIELQERVGEGSAISKPYFSWVTVPVELGLIVTTIFAWWIVKQIRLTRKLSRSGNREVEGLARFQSGFLIFLVLCATIENYFEFVQALMLPVMLYAFATARIAYCLEEEAGT